ncbi:helix-turn-helix transcriptional regulator [Lichenibacterium dinghuense]|uniref:helix-turn-helix transcriptional regulator n=1 Tax=Lichenibacterium dinghuense TaxID=2895977 RepID=UPI001F359E93|nr:helix-turn-helix transcriptional regulator [Lichenibacterium sp. 6Y81]
MDDIISAATLSSLIGLIYDAAINPGAWAKALDAIRTELNFGNATLSLHSLPAGEVLLNETVNIPQRYLSSMADYGPDVLDQWGGMPVIMQWPLDRPAVLSQVNPDVVRYDLTQNRYSLEWARPQGLIDVLAIPLARDARAVGSVAFGRHESAGSIGTREFEIARLLVPHLQRAATINRLLDLTALARFTFAGVVDTLSAPVLLVAADLRLIHANPAAKEMLAAADLIRVRGGVVSSTVGGVTKALAVAVTQAKTDESAMARRGLGIPVSRHGGGKAALHVLPLRLGRMAVDGGAAAAVFVARTDDPFVPPTEVVSALFGFTPAESRIFDQIVTGRTVDEAAAALDVELSTVKTHLQRIFSKTGVRRQGDLLRIAVSLAVPVDVGPSLPACNRKHPASCH